MSGSRVRRHLVSLRRCRIGVPGAAKAGWLVLYGGHLLAVLAERPDGEVALCAGLEEPFAGITMAWTDVASARADFVEVARLYRAGVAPAMIDFVARGTV